MIVPRVEAVERPRGAVGHDPFIDDLQVPVPVEPAEVRVGWRESFVQGVWWRVGGRRRAVRVVLGRRAWWRWSR